MVDKDKVIQIIRGKGPILPVQLVKEIGGNTMIAGAILSDLVKSQRVKISHAKIGASPVYYTEGQEFKLAMLYNSLHEKEKKVYDLLKKSRVLRDKELQPVERVALRQIKDFAFPLEVNLPSGKEIFWKWYLTPNSDAEIIIKRNLGLDKKVEPTISADEKKIAEAARLAEEERLKEIERKLKEREDKLKELEKKAEEREEPKPEIKPIPEVQPVPPEVKAPIKGPRPIKQEKQDVLAEKDIKADDDFLKSIMADFETKNITIKEIHIIRKNSDIEMIINVPSEIGDIDFFCKARNKKNNNDGDLSTTFLQGQLRKLPTIYLTTGIITKKAMAMLEKEFKGLIVIKL